MAKPVIISVDDDPAVLGAIVRDLRRRYAERYRILRADSGAQALEALKELRQRNETVALFLVDQRMPQMSGVEFLAEAIPLFPEAKRALLTAYADTDAAIQAINSAAINYYLLKPWDPPEQALYPVLDDLLDDWQANYRPPFEGIRVVGHRWSPEAHALKDFLARNHVPYLYLDIERDAAAKELLDQVGRTAEALPLVQLADGTLLTTPSVAELAGRVGLRSQAASAFYDLAIIGGGPAGLAAAVYGASEGLRTVLIEREAPGGQAGTSSRIENYLGFPTGLSGGDLARRAVAQARRFGVEMLSQEVTGLSRNGPYRLLTLADGSTISCHALVVSVGLSYRKIGAPGIDRLSGAGVYYGAAITEALDCRDQPVVIVGAGNSAGQAALFLAEHASKVIILVRGSSLAAKMSQYLVDRIEQHPQIEVRTESEAIDVLGEHNVESVVICHRPSGREEIVAAAALFIFTGAVPGTEWLADVLKRDAQGFVLTGPQVLENGKPPQGWDADRPPFLLEASVPGVFVVGDVRSGSVKRVASAVGEGSIAVQFVHQHLERVR
jgi:thioredoxin reductase (NADPH)